MDIVASPVDQNIIVSTGADTTIRFWSLDPAHKKQPCSIILAGEGHRETVLNIVNTILTQSRQSADGIQGIPPYGSLPSLRWHGSLREPGMQCPPHLPYPTK
jgi:WD40 repeat protein